MTRRDAAPVALAAPLSGWLCPLDEVPDEVFATRMMGDGLAIDPIEGELVAPCDGTVIALAPTAHAVTIRAANGAEILLHIGLETVALAGQGFSVHIETGQTVRQGDRLVSFELDAVALGASSLLSPIVVTNSQAFAFASSGLGRAVKRGDPIGTLVAAGGEAADDAASEAGPSHAVQMIMPLAHGLHARPAARIAAFAKQQGAELRLRARGRDANARSPVSMMTLGLGHADAFEIVAGGSNAPEAAARLAALIGAMADDDSQPAVPSALPPSQHDRSPAQGELRGVCAVPGIAVGPAFHLRENERTVIEDGGGIAAERAALDEAIAAVRDRLLRFATDPDPVRGAIAQAHLALLEDEDLLAAAQERLGLGKSAGFAWRDATRAFADRLSATGNALLAERMDDLLDLERQVLSAIGGSGAAEPFDIPAESILLAEDLLPSQWMNLDSRRLAGLCTSGGGPTSHVAIMAAAAGVPTLVAAGPAIADIPDGATLLLDATAGTLTLDPGPRALEEATRSIAAAADRRFREREAALGEARTADGARIHVLVNLGSTDEAAEAVAAGAEGCGLLRTEFLFLDRPEPPSEDEQLAAYQQIADGLGDRPLIVRTLDVGGDKPLPYLPLPHEENPALGLRGVRTALWRPDLLDEQLRAILRVRPAGRCRIMVPMIVAVDELLAVRARLDAVAAEIGSDGLAELGVMIETPAAALLADQLADEADFFSIGSNDLTQYALAMDRGNPLVAAQVDAFHPAVLRLIAATVGGASSRARPVGVCGAMASDAAGALLLVGLGITELSVAPAAVASIKSRLREVTVEQCRAVAAQALEARSAAAVRALVAEKLGTRP